jgi:hypothetical protein
MFAHEVPLNFYNVHARIIELLLATILLCLKWACIKLCYLMCFLSGSILIGVKIAMKDYNEVRNVQ